MMLENADIDKRHKPLTQRFEEKYIPEPNSGCWIWIGGQYQSGYGNISINNKKQKAHRVSYEMHKGKIPEGMFVCHSCDNPLCVNPDHLWVGTAIDNNADRHAKGRSNGGTDGPKQPAIGAKNPNSKLTEKQVMEIYRDPRSYTKISKDYGVRHAAVWRIKKKKTWRHLHESEQ